MITEYDSEQQFNNESDDENKNSETGATRDYSLIKTCDSHGEAVEFLRTIGSFSINKTKENEDGHIIEYLRCNLVKRRGPQCLVAAKIQQLSTLTAVNVLVTKNTDHTHTNAAKCKVNDRVIDKIKELKDLNVKSFNTIQNKLKETFNQDFTVNQIKRVIKNIKQPESILNFGELFEKLRVLSVVPENSCIPFVSDYKVDPDSKTFSFCLTSKTVLHNVKNFHHIHMDSTFKLSWHGLPLFVIGK